MNKEFEVVTDNYSKWKLLDRIYEAKRRYYNTGKTLLTDIEYDRLESSFKAIHGLDTFNEHYCIGYDEDKHEKIRKELLYWDIKNLEIKLDRGMIVPELERKIKEYNEKYGEL